MEMKKINLKQKKYISQGIGYLFISIIFLLTLIFSFFLFIELVFFLNLQYPNLSKKSEALQFSAQMIYDKYDRNIIQYLPECAEYDSDLFYTLKKNSSCEFSNREFSNKYNINSIGLRDSEKSLSKPEVIFIGDSFTMGWGVNQSEIFTSIVRKKLNIKTLNAGISSYGTARELEILKRVDTSNATHLIIQYCLNDLSENQSYIDNNKKIITKSKKDYENNVNKHLDRLKYYPFLYSYEHFKELYPAFNYLDNWRNERYVNRKKEHYTEAKYFLDTLNAFSISKKTKIILFENEFRIKNDWFLIEVNKLLSKEEYNELDIIFISTKDLIDEDYYQLDTHLNLSGHKKLANKIVNAIVTEKSDTLYEISLSQFDLNMNINNYGPTETLIGETFNLQENGTSTMWLKVENLRSSAKAYIDDIPLKTITKEGLAAVEIPNKFLLEKKIFKIFLKDMNGISNTVLFEVK
tara:strand:- start:4773 stop:6167 length:1395 start_codon:yes stop_codon:yes gene_type:complete